MATKCRNLLILICVFGLFCGLFAKDGSLLTDTSKKLEVDSSVTLPIDTLSSIAKDSLPVQSRNLYYRLTVDLPGKTAESYCRGLCQVYSGLDIFWEGILNLPDLSAEKGRTIQQEVTVSSTNLDSLVVEWNFRGVLYDSQLDKKYGPLKSEHELLDSTIEAIGFHLQVNPDGTLDMEKKVYRK